MTALIKALTKMAISLKCNAYSSAHMDHQGATAQFDREMFD
jgi:hypothetical protein